MSFATEIYPYRNNHRSMARRLLARVDIEFSALEAVPRYGIPNQRGRCSYEFHGDGTWHEVLGLGEYNAELVCDFSAQLTDKKVAKLLLKAFLRENSDRYLDYPKVRSLRNENYTNIEAAYNGIRQNAPIGGVKFIYNELPRSGRLHRGLDLFGEGITADMGYNQYYSRLVQWDNLHCFGLTMELARLNNLLQLGGGSTVDYNLQAASIWISRQQQNEGDNIYYQISH